VANVTWGGISQKSVTRYLNGPLQHCILQLCLSLHLFASFPQELKLVLVMWSEMRKKSFVSAWKDQRSGVNFINIYEQLLCTQFPKAHIESQGASLFGPFGICECKSCLWKVDEIDPCMRNWGGRGLQCNTDVNMCWM